jgi:peroxiredoxin
MLVLVVAALVSTGCGGDGTAGGGPTPAPSPAAPDARGTPAGPPTVPEALAFQARTVDGGEFDAATLAGQPVAFWFWAAWCPRCAAAAEHIRAVQSEYDTVQVVGVAGLGSGEAAMREFVDRHGLGAFPHLADDDGQVWRRFGVTTQEYFVILDASGQVIHQGPLSGQQLRDRLTALVG